MPDRPTLEHQSVTAMELGGRLLEITSAQLLYTQYWNGDEPAQREWEVLGRTHDGDLPEGVAAIVITVGERRLGGRVVMTSSRSHDLSVFQATGLDELRDA